MIGGCCFVVVCFEHKEISLTTTKNMYRKIERSKVVPDLGTMKDGKEQRYATLGKY